MGYFSNGTEGDCYEAEYCARCVHNEEDPEKPGCAVMLVHVLYAYEECGKQSAAEHMLGELIPRQGARNCKCRMFVNVEDLRGDRARRRQQNIERAGQAPLEFGKGRA